eukprot:COSAG01_NODE_22019_length_875_cov_85.698454_1_plen_47_part_10
MDRNVGESQPPLRFLIMERSLRRVTWSWGVRCGLSGENVPSSSHDGV